MSAVENQAAHTEAFERAMQVDDRPAAARHGRLMLESLLRENRALRTCLSAALEVQNATPCDRDATPTYEAACDAFDAAFSEMTKEVEL